MNLRRTAAFAVPSFGGMLFAFVAMPVVASSTTPDPTRGGKLFIQCAACHVVQPDGPNTVGPNLSGVLGAKAGTRRGYTYSPAMAKYGAVWNEATLNAFLQRPNQVVPGTKMGFAGVADADARADIIAYLKTAKAKR